VDLVDLVHHITKQITGLHAVNHAAKDQMAAKGRAFSHTFATCNRPRGVGVKK
jgi:hypothetical protein